MATQRKKTVLITGYVESYTLARSANEDATLAARLEALAMPWLSSSTNKVSFHG